MTSSDLLTQWTRERNELAFRDLVARHGTPVGLAIVYLQLESDSGLEKHQPFTNKGGGFWFDHFTSGTAILKVEMIDDASNPIRSVFRHVQLDSGQITQQIVNLSNMSRLEGRVAGLDGSEIGIISVLLGNHTLEDLSRKSPFGLFGGFEQLGSSGCDPDGGFHLDNLEPGEYTVVAQSFPPNHWESLHPLAVARVTVRDGETATATFEYK